MTRTIDLNADVGEGCGDDAAMMPLISSANIACGGHAGDTGTMAAAIEAALAYGVAVGAHPAYPDKEGFGRKSMAMTEDELTRTLADQLLGFLRIARAAGAPVHHVKPHGALYHDAAVSPIIADTICAVIDTILPGTLIYGPPQGVLRDVAVAQGRPYVAEGFADRRYLPTGKLVPRSEADAVLATDEERLSQALMIAEEGQVETRGGNRIPLPVQTICLHGDTAGAVASAQLIRSRLEEAAIEIAAPVIP